MVPTSRRVAPEPRWRALAVEQWSEVWAVVDIAAVLNLQARSRRNALVAAQRLSRNRADAAEAARALLPTVEPAVTPKAVFPPR
jgi:hypothetical protein